MVNPQATDVPAATITRVGDMKAPILGLQAGADQMMTQADTDAFKAALDKQGVPNDSRPIRERRTASLTARTRSTRKPRRTRGRILAFVDKYKK